MASAQVTIDSRLIEALKYAIAIIQSYEMDIRNSQNVVGIDLVEAGFCQGVIYTEATSRIARILEGGSHGI